MRKITIYTDGGARNNPGPSGAGIVITDEKKGVLKKIALPLGTQTNNWAEYEAVAHALQELKKIIPKDERGETEVEVRSDSELIIKQLRGEYQIKEPTLFPQFIKVWNSKVADFPRLSFTHIRREENTEADALSNEAMDEVERKAKTLFTSK
ncbi:MAG: ribonuclease HI family protein [Parcubacteria group bacterium]|nr:ribonuclease HI family protein [Parcubacteria group bacterium]